MGCAGYFVECHNVYEYIYNYYFRGLFSPYVTPRKRRKTKGKYIKSIKLTVLQKNSNKNNKVIKKKAFHVYCKNNTVITCIQIV